jgi:L-threonylcarbamoyladenylate synthase
MKRDTIFFYPTDTVWGMGGDIHSHIAQKLIAEIKQTDTSKPLSVLFTDRNYLEEVIDFKQLRLDNHLELFNYEFTLGVPLEYTDRSIPKYIYQDSEYLFIRFLPQLSTEIPKAITTTSVNITGAYPLNTEKEVREFISEHIPNKDRYEVKIVEHSMLIPSGNSSTIILVMKSGERKIIRKGNRFLELHKRYGL